LLLTKYHDNGGHPDWRRLIATLLKRFWWERMSFDCKAHCSNCVVCNRAKPRRQSSSSLSPVGVPNYPWEIVGMDFVTDSPKSSKNNFTVVLILVCHLTKMANFVPCHKEITTEDTIDLFINNSYNLHGVPKVIVSDRDPRFVGKFWQSFMKKLNTKLNTSTARHPQTDGLTARVNETMQILLRRYTTESGFDWVSHLPVVEFYYNCTINESSKHSPFEVTYGFQPSTRADRLLSLTGAPALVADRLTKLANVREVVHELLTLSKQRMPGRSSRPTPILWWVILFSFIPLKVYIFIHKNPIT
jgi:hypothetical protein